MMTEQKPFVLIAGAGPGLGQALMRRFTQGGFHSVGLVRSQKTKDEDLDLRQIDLSNAASAHAMITKLIGE